MNKVERKQAGKIRVVFGFLVFFIVFGVFVALAYIAVKHTGLSEFATVMLSGLGGLIFFCIFAALLSFIRIQRFKHTHRDFGHDSILNAFEQISHGNFDIFIEQNPNGPHSEMADAFNEMAKNLGSLETMRQDFISNVSHEIQSPLTSIKGFAALLQNDDLLPE